MSWKGILGKAGVSLTGLNGANDWTFEGAVHARNIISRFAGQHFHVDSGSSAASDSAKYGKRKEKPFATIDYAVGQCTANDGDVIWVHADHTEAVILAAGLALDVEGITIVFLGNGDDQAKITFGGVVGADMNVDADNITMINPRFESALDALTGPIDVNKTNFTIINGEYYDAAGKAATDCIVAGAAAKGLTIDGWKYFESTTGTQKQSNLQLNGVNDLTLKNIDVRGDFATGNIENITDEILNVRFKNIYLDNLNSGPKPGMVLDSNCDGFAENVNIRIASGTTYLSNDSDINWGPNCRGYAADGGSGEPLGTSPAGDIEAKVDVIDGYHDVPVKNAATDTVMRDVVGRKTDSAAAGAVSEEESVMAYAKQAVTEGIARDAVIGALNTAAAAGAVTDADLMMAYIKQLVTAAITEAAQSLKLDGVTLATAPVANSLAAYIASGGTVLGQELPDSQSLIDLLGDFTGPHDGVAADDNIKAILDLIIADTGTDGVVLGTDAITVAKIADDAFSEEHFDGDAVQAITMGKKVSKATVVLGGGTTNLFNVATGRVVVHAIVGEVTIIVQGQATGCKLISTPTVGTAVDLCVALDLTGDEAGCLYGITGLFSDALVGSNAGATVSLRNPIIVPVGVIGVNNGGAANTGSVKWDIYYTPLDTGAVITAV